MPTMDPMFTTSPPPLLSHIRDDKLRKPHRGEKVRFKCSLGSIHVRVHDRTYQKFGSYPLNAIASTFALLTSMSSRPDSLSTLLMTLLRPSSSVTSNTICQQRSQYPGPVLIPVRMESPSQSPREKNRPSIPVCVPSRRPCIPRQPTPRIFRITLVRHLSHRLGGVQRESDSTFRASSDQDHFRRDTTRKTLIGQVEVGAV